MKANTRIESGAVLWRILPSLPMLLLSGSVACAAGDSYFPARDAPVDPTPKVDLGGAGHFVILSESGSTDVPASAVTGNVGVSPITGAADHLSCAEVTGKIYSVDAAGPPLCSIKAPKKLNNAVGDMQAAYTDAAGRTATIINKGGGNIGGLTLGPGVYNWTTDVNIASNVTIKGGSHAVWIFQIAKNLNVSSGAAVVLRGHAQAQNIFWQIAGTSTLGTTSQFVRHVPNPIRHAFGVWRRVCHDPLCYANGRPIYQPFHFA
jgi:hypothetical protein